ncbi:MAG: hypothetical protein K9J38_01200 [Polynucleobacter sp.]|nr:hypothetical protein [Polynucleobacter sp.]
MNQPHHMNKYFKIIVLVLISLSLFLSGCNLIDEYYVYDDNLIKQLTTDLEKSESDDTKKIGQELRQMMGTTKIRYKLTSSPQVSLVVIRSGKYSDSVKKKQTILNSSVQESDSTTYDTCDYVNDKNWICKFGRFGPNYEMREGDLYYDGQKLLKKYSLNF